MELPLLLRSAPVFFAIFDLTHAKFKFWFSSVSSPSPFASWTTSASPGDPFNRSGAPDLHKERTPLRSGANAAA